MSWSRVTHFFKAAHSDEDLLLAAKEATFVCHDVVYGESFRSSHCNLLVSFKLF